MDSLLTYLSQRTAYGLARGKVYTTSQGGYTLVGSREPWGFSVTLLRGADPIYREPSDHPAQAAMKMVEVWGLLRRKLAQDQPWRPYRRMTI